MSGVSRIIRGGTRPFAAGVLVDLAAMLRDMRDGDLIVVTSSREDLAGDLTSWSRLTGHGIVASERDDSAASATSRASATEPGPETEAAAMTADTFRFTIRKGEAVLGGDDDKRPIGSRLWLYSNFDCNLRCDYCCARSSPTAARRPLGKEAALRIAREARTLGGVESLFVTGGEPFLLNDIVEILEGCADAAPTTVLTNGMVFTASRMQRLRALSRDVRERIVLQISIDSATPELHDLHRGRGSWEKGMKGVHLARDAGFRVRLAATVSSDRDEAAFRAFLDHERIAEEDRIVRRIALRGFATEGVPLARRELVPEPTFTDRGVYWHPVGATDDDFLVTTELFPLRDAIDKVREQWSIERELHDTIAQIFHCA